MHLRITIHSDLMAWEKNKEKFGNTLSIANVNNDECELDIAKIPDELLLPIIENHIKDEVENDEIETIQPIEGGLRIDFDDATIEWMCCEDITDFYHWETTLNQGNIDWTQLWIGHPWIFFRILNNKIQFSNYSDIPELDTQNLQITMELEYDEFQKHLQSKLIEMNTFKEKIRRTINQSKLLNKETIITRLRERG